MKLENLKIGFAITGSFCNFSETKSCLEEIQARGVKEIIPIMSFNAAKLNTRFYKADEYIKMVEEVTHNKIIDTIEKAEPIGPKNLVDIIVVLPCTGNTLAKLANGISDSPVTIAIKSHIRNNKPVVIGISTNDGLGVTLKNIGEVINMKNFYFIPFRQDDSKAKPKSLVLDYNHITDTMSYALDGKQIQPILAK